MEWFKNWFNSDYLSVYSRRTSAQAREESEFALGVLGLAPSDRVLDVGCGTGRHVAYFQENLAFAVGIDLSQQMLSAGVAESAFNCARADMRRLPFASESFSGLSCFFTGFGYLDTDADHLRLLQEWARVLRPGGKLFLDFLHADNVVRDLTPHSVRQVGPLKIEERRTVTADGRRLIKQIHLSDDADHHRDYRESVRLFSESDLRQLLQSSGYTVTASYGNFAGAALGPNSERVIIVATRGAQ